LAGLVGLTIIDFERYWRGRRDELIGLIARRFEISSRAAEDIIGSVAMA